MTQTRRDDILAEQERHRREDTFFIPIERSNRLFTQADDLSCLDLPHALLQDSTFAGTNMERIILTSANLDQARLLEARLDFATMQDVSLHHARLMGCMLHEADLRFAHAAYSQFIDCHMRGALFHSANLYCALFGGAPASLMDLSHSDWRQASLIGAVFAYCNLDFANFGESDLDRAIFLRCSLRHAVFIGAKNLGTTQLYSTEGEHTIHWTREREEE